MKEMSSMLSFDHSSSEYKGTAFHVNFLNFLLFALPVALIMLVLCWLWLQILYNGKEFVLFISMIDYLYFNIYSRFFQCRTDPQTREVADSLKLMLQQQYKDLGKPK